MPTKSDRKKEYRHGALREAALKAAIELIAERGDASFGLRDLAARVGVSHPALYRHFADRAALFRTIAYEGFVLYGATQQVALETAPQCPTEQLVILGLNHLRFALQNPSYFRVMFGAKVVEHKIDDDSLSVVATPTLQRLVDVSATLKGPEPQTLLSCCGHLFTVSPCWEWTLNWHISAKRRRKISKVWLSKACDF